MDQSYLTLGSIVGTSCRPAKTRILRSPLLSKAGTGATRAAVSVATTATTSLRDTRTAPSSRRLPATAGRIDHQLDFRHTVDRKAAPLCVLTQLLLIGGDVDAVHFVPAHVAVKPLHVAQLPDDLVGLLGQLAALLGEQIRGPRDLALDHVFRHG